MDVNRMQSQEMATWKEKYMAALFEMDKDRLNQRITDAEMAVVQRTRELFHTGSAGPRPFPPEERFLVRSEIRRNCFRMDSASESAFLNFASVVFHSSARSRQFGR